MISLGVTTTFGIPGTGYSIDFLSSFVGAGGSFHLTKHEATGAIMAGTVGNRLGIPCIAICANGTARINMLAGVMHCRFEMLPVIALWDEEPKDKQYFQKLQRLPEHDTDLFFNHVIDRFDSNGNSLAKKLVELTMEPEQGPVGVKLRPLRSDKGIEEQLITYRTQSVSYIKSRLSRSRYPLFIFGRRCVTSPLENSVRDLFQGRRIAKLTTLSAKGLFPEVDPYCFQTFTGVGGSNTYESKIMDKADLIVAINLKHDDVINVSPFDKESIFLDYHSPERSEGFRPDSFCYLNFSQLVECVEEVTPEWSETACLRIKTNVKDSILTEKNQCGRLIDRLSPILYGKAAVVVDDGIYQKLSEYFLLSKRPCDYVATSVGRNMGSALPAAIAICKTSSEEPVVCFTGDGGLPMYLSELSLIKDKLPKLLILHFAEFSLVSIRTRALDHVNVISIANDSYINLIQELGFVSESIGSTNEIEIRVRSWIERPYPLFIEFTIDSPTYPDLFHYSSLEVPAFDNQFIEYRIANPTTMTTSTKRYCECSGRIPATHACFL